MENGWFYIRRYINTKVVLSLAVALSPGPLVGPG